MSDREDGCPRGGEVAAMGPCWAVGLLLLAACAPQTVSSLPAVDGGGGFGAPEVGADAGASDAAPVTPDAPTGGDADAASRDAGADAAFTCTDGVRSGAETDVDCGGRWCAPCAAGRSCASATDCASGTCEQGVCAEAFRVDDRSIGRDGVVYVDPEFLDVLGTRMAYTDAARTPSTLWVADIDPVTGALANPAGPDQRITSDVVPIADAVINGVEWGASREGPSLFYTRRDADGRRQVFRTDLRASLMTTQLTRGPQEHVHWIGTADADAAWQYTFIGRFDARLPQLFATRADAPRFDVPLTGYYWPGNNGPRFIAGTRYFVYSRQLSAEQVELVRVDLTNGSEAVVTDDRIPKVDVWGFVAPEFGSTVAYAAKVSPTELAIYRYARPGDAHASRVGTITVPAGHPHRYITSVELLSAPPGRLDRTYLAFRGSDSTDATQGDASMWVASLGSLPRTWTVRRVDEGATSGARGYRIEPEWLLGRDEAFLYYNAFVPPAAQQLRRCRTGVVLR